MSFETFPCTTRAPLVMGARLRVREKRRDAPSLPLAPVLLVVASSALMACGSDVVKQTTGPGGQDGGGGSPDCSIFEPGASFQFVIHNVGSRALAFQRGCGKTLPIILDTPDGPRGISEGSGDYCEVSCDLVYGGKKNTGGCTDCGDGGAFPFLPGETITIDWDRRVYIEHVAPAACTGHEDGNGCALGVSPGQVTSGTLTICNDSQSRDYCFGDEEPIAFALDLGLSMVTINVE